MKRSITLFLFCLFFTGCGNLSTNEKTYKTPALITIDKEHYVACSQEITVEQDARGNYTVSFYDPYIGQRTVIGARKVEVLHLDDLKTRSAQETPIAALACK